MTYVRLIFCVLISLFNEFLPIFAVNRVDTITRCEKYSSKLDISRSLITIFVITNSK